MGKLIVFEGADQCGKETQSKLLTNVLRAEGFRVTRVEPTKEGHPRGRKLIYSMLENGSAKRWPNTFQFVQFLNRMYFQVFKLPKLLHENQLVILDRWALSGWVYGAAENVNESFNKWMYNRARKADLVVVQSGASYKRQQVDDSYERDTSLQARVKVAYRDVGLNWPGHALVDNHDAIMDVHNSIRALLENKGIIVSTRCSLCGSSYDETCGARLHP
jgi:thymidylate kinase